MPKDMELGNDSSKEHITDFELYGHREHSKTTCKVDAPLTHDIIGDNEHSDGNTHQCGE
jgi:hypothetical protein